MSAINQQIRKALIAVLTKYDQAPEPLPDNLNSGNCHKKLSRQNVIDATRLLTGFFDMAGSAGDFDIYTVLIAYYRDPAKRARINAALR